MCIFYRYIRMQLPTHFLTHRKVRQEPHYYYSLGRNEEFYNFTFGWDFDEGRVFFPETRKGTRFFRTMGGRRAFHHRFCNEGTPRMAWSQAYDTLRWALLRSRGFLREVWFFFAFEVRYTTLRRAMKQKLPTALDHFLLFSS
jgi:hypothetical protein